MGFAVVGQNIEDWTKAMSVKLTLTLSDTIVESAKRVSRSTEQAVETVLTNALETLWPAWNAMPTESLNSPVSALSDVEVMAVADMKMSVAQNTRLAELQSKGKSIGLSEMERHELTYLLYIYQIGLLRKSEGFAEAVRRGLRKPLSDA